MLQRRGSFLSIKNLFAPPLLEAGETAYVARLLNVVLWCMAAAGLLYVPLLTLGSPENLVRFAIQGGAIVMVSVTLSILVKKGRLRIASVVLTVCVWLVMTESARTGGGVLGAGYLGLYVVIVLSGILLGPIGGFVALVCCTLTGLWFVHLANTAGLPPSVVENSPLNVWENSLFFFLIIFVAQSLSSQTIRHAFARLRKELSERRSLESALSSSEERFHRLSDATFEGIALSESDVIIEVNGELEKMFGYGHDELAGCRITQLVAPESRDHVLAKIRSDDPGPYELNAMRKDATIFPVEARARMLRRGERKLRVSAIRDITDRKRAEAEIVASLREKEMLLKEIHHRVKNNLQVVSSLLSLQARDVKDAHLREAFQESQNRVRSMAMVHDKLYGEGTMSQIDFGQYVSSVTKELQRSLGKENVVCTVEAAHVSLGIDLAIPCGLIVNELVSNALKHAFKNRDAGKVVVCIRHPDDGKVEISVADNGLGFPRDIDFRTVSSMGMTLILALTDQIGGTISMDGTDGTTFTVTFPVRKHAAP